MTPAELSFRRVRTAAAAVWPAATWRATRNALAAMLLALAGSIWLGLLGVLWWAAVIALTGWPAGGWAHAALYLAMVLAGPVLGLWAVQGLTALQRSRLRATLGVEIPAGSPPAARLPWPAGPWLAAATWRQLGFHLLSVLTGLAGGALVAACWLAPAAAAGYLVAAGPPTASGAAVSAAAAGLLLAAPALARLVTRADVALARALLGPSHNEELALRLESLARSRADIIAATDAERRRIERDLHDGAQQRLVSLAMNLGMTRARFPDAPEPVLLAIADAHDEAMLALSELREFIRGLHPAVLNDRGLDAALSGLAARAPLPVRLQVDVREPASASVEAVAYFIVSEALTNVAKHAQASHAEVSVVRDGDMLRLAVSDDGSGGAAAGDGDEGAGSGLRGLIQRAASVDGSLTIQSPPGGPTIITAELPCES